MLHIPNLTDYKDEPIYNTQAVVQMTKVQAPRLRAWERRYSFLTPQRGNNKYRLYSERDIVVIRWLRDQVDAGMSISQATSYLRDNLDRLAILATNNDAETSYQPTNSNMAEMSMQLVDYAYALDENGAYQILSQALASHSVEDVCVHVITPALTIIGEAWLTNEQHIINEHFLTEIVRSQLESLLRSTHNVSTGRMIMVGAAPGEHHELGPLMLALFLRRQNIRVTFLGQNLATAALLRMASEGELDVICLSVTLPQLLASTLQLLIDLSQVSNIITFVGGQAVTPEYATGLPVGIHYLHGDIQASVAAIQKSIGTA